MLLMLTLEDRATLTAALAREKRVRQWRCYRAMANLYAVSRAGSMKQTCQRRMGAQCGSMSWCAAFCDMKRT